MLYTLDNSSGTIGLALKLAEENITSISFQADGNLLALGTSKGSLYLYDFFQAKMIRHIPELHQARINCLSWKGPILGEHLPSGCALWDDGSPPRILSTGSGDHSSVHLDLRLAHPRLMTLRGHRHEVCGLGWNAESRMFATGGNDNLMQVWDDRRFDEPLHRVAEHRAAVKALAWSPIDPACLLTGGGMADRTVRVWDVGPTACELRFASDTGAQISGAVWSRAGTEFALAHGYPRNSITVWEMGRLPAQPPVSAPACIPPSGDQPSVYSQMLHARFEDPEAAGAAWWQKAWEAGKEQAADQHQSHDEPRRQEAAPPTATTPQRRAPPPGLGDTPVSANRSPSAQSPALLIRQLFPTTPRSSPETPVIRKRDPLATVSPRISPKTPRTENGLFAITSPSAIRRAGGSSSSPQTPPSRGKTSLPHGRIPMLPMTPKVTMVEYTIWYLTLARQAEPEDSNKWLASGKTRPCEYGVICTRNKMSDESRLFRWLFFVVRRDAGCSLINQRKGWLIPQESLFPPFHSLRVIARFRPLNRLELSKGGKPCVAVTPDGKGVSIISRGEGKRDFQFDHVFQMTSTQAEVFDIVARPVVDDVLNGYNGSVLAYGQTSSGKTHTMMGPDIANEELRGITPRMVYRLFEGMNAAPETVEFTLKIQYVEIYMERIRDLLDPSNSNLEIHEDKARGVYIAGCSEVYVTQEQDIFQLLEQGGRNRVVAATGMNEGSSRSHSLFMLTVSQKDVVTLSQKSGRFYLVDLAGSEKIATTHAEGQRLEEAKKINLSLTCLGNVINALTDGKATHIPYRDSRLTRILQDSIGGNSRTTLIICASSSTTNDIETLSTMRFGARAKTIKNQAKVNQEYSVGELKILLQKAEREIESLKVQVSTLEGEVALYQGLLSVFLAYFRHL
ncbi:putative Kinesin heavy chain [Paratrimastix pyriformis]|uniref:Kinesin-like protein n=1 Tax=Paratrimastix pyriformis TaxID=342808 RepID=A0ABQ8UZA0_9EUKA|nr:putative Kinesin heavy chain [Paratrimastix pyriformis]